MKLVFSYNLDKEYINFKVAFSSMNHREMSRVQSIFYSKYDIVNKKNVNSFVKDYLNSNNISIPKKIKEIKNSWEKIEKKFYKRAEKIFDYKLPQKKISVFLTVNDRCSYNFEKNYFFVHLNPKTANKVIMHELLHWYFQYSVGAAIKKMFGKEIHNDLKESLTVLINTEFSGLLPKGVTDRGYPQHQRLRKKIIALYKKEKDIYKVIGCSLKTIE